MKPPFIFKFYDLIYPIRKPKSIGYIKNEITIVTTFHIKMYDKYAYKMLASIRDFWPKNVNIVAFYEKKKPTKLVTGVFYMNIEKHSPDLIAFKEKFANTPKANGSFEPEEGKDYNFKFDAIRFSHKVYSILFAHSKIKGHYLIWLDADTLTFNNISHKTLKDNFLPKEDQFVSYLGRDKMYSECGFVAYNLNNPYTKIFMEELKDLYNTGKVLELDETHDSFVFDYVRKRVEEKYQVRNLNISKGEASKTMHPFINSKLGKYMDHLKGKRKGKGKSHKSDLVVKHNSVYWNNGE